MGTALGSELRTHGWWIALSVVSTIAVTALFGFWLFPLYGLVNVGGVWSVRHDLRDRRPRLQMALSVGAVLLLPVGLVGPLFTEGGPTYAERVSNASGDEGIMAETSRTSFGPPSHGSGG